jgi:hypothetical protein
LAKHPATHNILMEVAMLDDLRNSASSSFEEQPLEPGQNNGPKAKTDQPFLGMTAPQRFVVALLLFLAVVIIGALFLVVSDKVAVNLPGLLGF